MAHMKALHPLQTKLLKVLGGSIPEGGYSLGALRDAIGASSKSQVVHHVAQLEQKGLLKTDPSNPDGYIVFGHDEPEAPYFFMPLLALAACGKGIDNEQNVIEKLPVRSALIPGKVEESFLVKADGDSMEPRIHHGDILMVEQYKDGMPEPNKKIIVCEVNHETKIKRFVKSGGTVVLESLNKKYDAEAIEPKKKDFRVIGVVRGILFSQL